MDYEVLVANGDAEYNHLICDVNALSIVDGVYMLKGKKEGLLFSSPVDSVVFIKRSETKKARCRSFTK